MTNIALMDRMRLDELEISAEAAGIGAVTGLVIASLGQFAVPVGLATGIFGAINENERLRNRGFAAAGIGVGAFLLGALIAGASVAAVDQPVPPNGATRFA